MKEAKIALLILGLWISQASAQQPLSFQGKTLNMYITAETGGGTDAFGRLVARYLPSYLEGTPNIVVKNLPGGDGIVSMNFMVQQAPRDGTAFITASNTQADPLIYRRPQSQFNPAKFAVIGGVGRGGEVLIISKDAEKRLYDKSAVPVVVATLGGVPRSGIQMAAWGAEYLGWNIKWVVGYRGTNELMLALERGEVDMTGTGNIGLIKKLEDTGKFKVLYQSGTQRNGKLVGRSDFGKTPIFSEEVQGKIKDKIPLQAFSYWSAMANTDKWIALPPETSPDVVAAYRAAFSQLVQNDEFLEQGKKISDGFDPMTPEEVQQLLTTLAELPPEATEYMLTILRKQGMSLK